MNFHSQSRRSLIFKIQKEVLHQRPVFDSYQRVCKNINTKVMNFVDYEFWYMRFYNQKLIVNRSTRSLSDMPPEIIEKITENLDPIDRLIARNVCRTFRRVIDNQKSNIDRLEIIMSFNEIQIKIHENTVNFYKNDRGCLIWSKNHWKFIEGTCYTIEVIHFLRPLISNPKMNLKLFCLSRRSFGNFEKHTNLFVQLQKSINFPLRIESVFIEVGTSFLLNPIFSMMSPQIQQIQLIGIDKNELCCFLETEQFKQARHVIVFDCEELNFSDVHNFLHLITFQIRLLRISNEEFFGLLKVLSKSPTFAGCELYLRESLNLNELGIEFNEPIIRNHPYGDIIHHLYPIPNSTSFLCLMIKNVHFKVKKIERPCGCHNNF